MDKDNMDHIVLITIKNIKKVNPFSIDKSEYGNMDDWLPIENIERVKVNVHLKNVQNEKTVLPPVCNIIDD